MAEVISRLNIAQELFLVLFSILYGIMLQSMSGLHPFPLGRTCRGYVKRDEEEPTTDFEHCEKNGKQLVRMWRKRVVLPIFFLNVLPLLYFFVFLSGLSRISISSVFSILDFPHILFIFWSAVGVFGFYRIYHAIVASRWETLFCDVDLDKKRPFSFDAKAHLLWGLLFYLLPPILYFLFFNCLLVFMEVSVRAIVSAVDVTMIMLVLILFPPIWKYITQEKGYF